jgi:type I restriction enzyme S subunit
MVAYIQQRNTGSSVPLINLGILRSLPLPLPPLREQLAITAVVGALDDKIHLNGRMNETLEAMARAFFKDWFIDFGPTRSKMEGRAPYLPPDIWARFPDCLDQHGMPQDWSLVPARELIEFNPPEKLSGGAPAPYLDMAALPTSGSWMQQPITRDFASGAKFRNGDALLARITPCLENGKTAFVQTLNDGAVGWGSTEFIVMRAKSALPAAYAYILARDPAFRDRAIQSMTGTSGRQRVQTDRLADFLLAKPSPKVARAFSDLISPVFEKIKTNAQEAETLAATRDLLLPKLMSGAIRMKDSEKELEKVA